MGTFTINIQVGDLAGQQFIEVEALVDTGSTYTVLPTDLLFRLGVSPLESRPFRLGDERLVEYPIGEARLRLDGRQLTAVVVFAQEGTGPVVGATTLENFGLGVDPIGRRLIPVPTLLK